ncbi:MAG: hypothetical protein V7542_16265, partial [Limnobacter sp.]|uniref:hypothetical protein n=1 Tax=Limnobacter sp. TaxID=2003368 RepID=UPI003001F658
LWLKILLPIPIICRGYYRSRAKVDELIALKLVEVQQVKIHLEALEQKLTDIQANNAAIAHELAQNPNEPEGEFLIADYIIPIRNDAKK